MGRKNKEYSISLSKQIYNRLTQMQAFGESKRDAMKDGTVGEKIFSYATYESYKKHIGYFVVNGKYFSRKKGIYFSRNAANYFPEFAAFYFPEFMLFYIKPAGV